MKQSELKHWKWDAKAAWWLSDVVDMEVEADGFIKTWKPSPNQRRWSPQALVNFARELLVIAEHIEAGGCGPDEERPTRDQIHRWLQNRAWCWTGELWAKGVCRLCVDPGCENQAITAIALLEQRPKAEIVREVLEL